MQTDFLCQRTACVALVALTLLASNSTAFAQASAPTFLQPTQYGGPQQSGGQPYRPGQSWQRVQFPDGSGSIAVPPGWRISSAQRSTVEMHGPRGDGVAIGVTFSVGPAQFVTPVGFTGPYLPPVEAFAWVSEVMAKRNGGATQTRVTEVQQTPPLTQGGRAVYLLADQMTQGRHYRALALVNTANLSNGFWQYYMTAVFAPAEVFAQSLPMMLEIWHSWNLSQGEMSRRTATAIATMKETNAIMQQTAEGRRTTQWHQELTGMTLQGRWVIEDTQTGQRISVTVAEMNSLFQTFPGRYRQLGAQEMR
jgi:hypothetical protein